MKIKIDNQEYDFEENQTILEVARKNGIKIPTLCYLKGVCQDSSCRICVVEDLKSNRLILSCNTPCVDGMELLTNSERVVASRKKTLELMLSTHNKDCSSCKKSGYCKFQELLKEYKLPFFHEFKRYKIDESSPCIVRDINKCILCGRCAKICSQTQSVDALTKQQRGYNTFMGCAFDMPMSESTCVGCGQCALVCPTGAITEKDETKKLKELLANKDNYVVCQVAPSVRVSLAEMFGEKIGTFDEGRMVSALKKLGFQKVFDINLGADFTVYEEANELIERVKNNTLLPQFSSCCPAWFKFTEKFYPEYANHISSCKSPTEMLGALVKNFYSEKYGIDKNKIKVVGIMPCTAKKGEKERAEDVDLVLTTREIGKLIDERGIDYLSLPHEEFDSPLSYYSGAGLIFGATGGVTEAVLRFAIKKLNPNENKIEFHEVRNGSGIKEVDVKLGDTTLKICVVSGLANARKVVEDIKQGKQYHFVEVMACPGGCVNGGGQAYVDYDKIDASEVKNLRASSIYKKDSELKVRVSDENEYMNNIYKEFFIPSPKKAHELLHIRRS